MTFPTIPTTGNGRIASLNQLNTTATLTGPNLNTLTSRAAGDLVIAIAGEYQSNAGADAAYTGWAGGGLTWTEIRDSTGTADCRLGVAYARLATGSETGTVTVTRSGTLVGDASMIIMVIPGAHASTAPEATAVAVATAAAANPASLSPSWGTEDTLWITVCGNGMTSATGSWTGIDGAPTNYSDLHETNASDTSTIGDFSLGVAFRQNAAASEDAAGFSQDTSNARSAGLTIAVRPVLALVVQNADQGQVVGAIGGAQGSTPAFGTIAHLPYPGAGGTTAAVPKPASAAQGDLIMVSLLLETITSAPTNIQTPSGVWVKESEANDATTNKHLIYSHYVGASDPSTYDFTWTTSALYTAYATRITGGHASIAVDTGKDHEVGTASTNAPVTTITTKGANRLLFWTCGAISGGSGWTPPSGFTERGDQVNISVATLGQSSAGSSGSVGGSNGNSDVKIAYLGALRPTGALDGDPLTLEVASTPTLTVANAAQAQTAQNIALIVTIPITNVAQAQTSTTIALNVPLILQNMAQAQTSTTIALNVPLILQNTAQAQTAQNLALTQVHNLVVQNAAQAQMAQNLALTQVHNLVVQPVKQKHTALAPGTGLLARSRDFDGTDDEIIFSAGNLGTGFDGGPVTFAILWKPDTLHRGGLIYVGSNAGAQVIQMNQFDDGNVWLSTEGGAVGLNTWTGSDGWRIDTARKGTGNVAPVSRYYRFDTDTWAVGNAFPGNVPDSANTPQRITLGHFVPQGTDFLNGQMAAVAVWKSELSTVQIEGLSTSLQSWMDLAPDWMVILDQASTATTIEDLIGSGDQTSITGTSVSTDVPRIYGLGEILLQVVLGAQPAAQAQTVQNIALTQVHVLTVQNTAQAQTAQNIALNVPLLVNHVAQAQTSQNTTLTQTHVLTVQAASQGQSAPSLTLGAAGTLTVQAASQGQKSHQPIVSEDFPDDYDTYIESDIILVQLHVLVVQNAAQAQTTQNIALTQVHVLTVQNVAQAQTAQNIALVVVIPITNVAQAQSLPNLILGLPGQLSVNPADQAQTVGNLVLTQLHVLTVQNAVQAQTAQNVVVSKNLVLANIAQAQTAQNIALNIPLVIQAAAQAQTTGNVVLERIFNLVMQNAAQAQTAQQVPLGTLLVMQNAAQAQTAQNIALVQQHILAGLGVAQAQSIPNVGITKNSALVNQNAAQAQTVGNLVILRIFNLLLASVAQAQTSTSIGTMSGGSTLAGLGIAHPSTATVLVLIQLHVLAVQGALTPQQVLAIELGIGALPLLRRVDGRVIQRYGNGRVLRQGGDGGRVVPRGPA